MAGLDNLSPTTTPHGVSPQVPILARSSMLVNARGDREFVGDAASLSFIQYLRELLAQHLSPSIFSENRGDTTEPWTGLLDRMPVSSVEDAKQKHIYLESYLAASTGLLDVYNMEELESLMAATGNAEETIPNESNAALYIAIAIGAQCLASCRLDQQYAKKYFYLGQKAAFQSMVEDPDIGVTRCFVLMAFYMLGACRRNAAFMYLGIAAKSAYALGLHMPEHYISSSRTEKSIRSRIWKSLRVMDVITNTIMGRLTVAPPMMVGPDTLDPSDQEEGSHRGQCMSATFRFISMMDQIFHNILPSKSISVDTGEKYLKKLNALSTSLPSDLRKFSGILASTLAEQEPLIGNIHVSCSYYWAVMLVTRPFLMYRMTRPQRTSAEKSNSDALLEDQNINKLARVCVWAGVHVAQNCHQLLKPGSLIHNLCILKAWIFSSSLVLGFSMLIPDDSSFDVQDALAKAGEVLEMLTKASPRRERYYDVLNCFMAAIYKYRQSLADERRKTHQNLLMDILTVEVNQSPPQRVQSSLEDNRLGPASYDRNHREILQESLPSGSGEVLDMDISSPLQQGPSNDVMVSDRDENGHGPTIQPPWSPSTPLPLPHSQFQHTPFEDLNATWWEDFAADISQMLPFNCGVEPLG